MTLDCANQSQQPPSMRALAQVFAVLLKALLYWNAYIRILAPDMSVFQDERLILRDAIEPQ